MDRLLKIISNCILVVFLAYFFLLLRKYCSHGENIHKALFYQGGVKDILHVQLNYFLGWALILPNMKFFGPIIWVSARYAFFFYCFLVVHRISGNIFLNPGRDCYNITYLNRGYWGHLLCALEFFGRHFLMLGGIYLLMGMFRFECPTPLLRELFAFYLWHAIFGMYLKDKVHIGLSPFIMVRPLYLATVFLVFVEYVVPGRGWDFIPFLPLAYIIWVWKVGLTEYRHCGILFYNYIVPEPGDELYEEFCKLRRERSLFFRVYEYVNNKVK